MIIESVGCLVEVHVRPLVGDPYMYPIFVETDDPEFAVVLAGSYGDGGNYLERTLSEGTTIGVPMNKVRPMRLIKSDSVAGTVDARYKLPNRK